MLPWTQHHICKGFAALEKLLNNSAGKYATGDEILLADCFIAPQVDVASKRFKVDMREEKGLDSFIFGYASDSSIHSFIRTKVKDGQVFGLQSVSLLATNR